MIFEKTKAMKNLTNAINSKNLPSALLFYGEDELSNNTFAIEFLQMFFCENHNFCKVCESCIKMISNSNPDLLTFPKNESFQVADANEIIENAQISPMINNYKVIYIKNLDKSTETAQNKILKILEEPPKRVIFVITTSKTSLVLPTILSRCNKVCVEELDYDSAREYFKDVDSEIFSESYKNFGGFLGKLENSFLDGKIKEISNLADDIFNNLKSSKEIISYSSKLCKNKNDFLVVLKILENKFRSILGKNILSNLCIAEIIEELNKAKKEIENNVSLGIVADNLLMQMLQIKFIYK